MKFIDVLGVMGRFTAYIQVGYDGKNSGVMRVGNIPYKKISHYNYGKHVLSITPCYKNGKNILFVQLVHD